MKKFCFLCSIAIVLASLLSAPCKAFSKEISLQQLPAAIEQLHTKLPIIINDAFFWMECYQEEPDSQVEIVIQVNSDVLDVSSSEYIEYLNELDHDQISDILGDQIMSFIDKCPVPVRVNLAFTDFKDYRILFKK